MPNDISVLLKVVANLEKRIEDLEFAVKSGLVGPGPWPIAVHDAAIKASLERDNMRVHHAAMMKAHDEEKKKAPKFTIEPNNIRWWKDPDSNQWLGFIVVEGKEGT